MLEIGAKVRYVIERAGCCCAELVEYGYMLVGGFCELSGGFSSRDAELPVLDPSSPPCWVSRSKGDNE